MKRKFWFFLQGIGLLFLGSWLGACGAHPEPIRIAISAWAGVEPAELAAQLGLYEKNGVNVEMVRFSAYSDSIDALRGGNVDAGMHTLDDAIRYYSSGSDVRIVLLTDYSYGGDGLVALPGISYISDLKGRKIGVEIGTVGHLSLLKILEMGELSVEDVEIVSIPAWEIQQAMPAGTIDAGVTWEPYLTSTAEMTGGKVLITSRDYPETIITTMTFDAETVRQRPEDVKKVVASYFEAVEYIKNNPEDAYKRMGVAEGISAEEFEAHVVGIQYLDLEDNVGLFGLSDHGRIYTKTQEIAKFLFEHGVIKTLPDASQLLDPDFVRELY